MKELTARKRIMSRINKDYPLLKKGLRYYFYEIIYLMYENMCMDIGYEDMTCSQILNYSYEINTCDEYHNIIIDYDKNVSDIEKLKCEEHFNDFMCGRILVNKPSF